jgi:hypothetical protein
MTSAGFHLALAMRMVIFDLAELENMCSAVRRFVGRRNGRALWLDRSR